MATTRSLEDVASNLFWSQWHQEGSGAEVAHEAGDPPAVTWVLDRLVRMVIELHGQPVRDLKPLIRRLIAEQSFVEEGGVPVANDHRQVQIDRQVDVVVRVLEQVRRRALARGMCSDMPLTPQMFG